MMADLGARVQGYDNMQLQIELRETHEQLRAKTMESLEFQVQLAQTQTHHSGTKVQHAGTKLELAQTQLELLETRRLTDEILAENQSLQFKCQITEQEVCDLRQFKHSITAVTSGHAFWQSSWGS